MLTLPLLAVLCEAAILASPFDTKDKPYPQTVSDAKNLLKYTGNAGPYSDRKGYGIDRDPPAGCRVDQVVMLHRHGERWPTTGAYKSTQKALDKIMKHKGKLKGDLEFANSWEPYASVNDGWLAEESLEGPYSGLLNAYTNGVMYRQRYGHLYDPSSQLPIFSCAYQRVLDTARKFGQGFLQWSYTDMAAVNLVLESYGANTLAPECDLKNATLKENSSLCPDYGVYDEFEVAAKRLNKQNKDLDLKLKGKNVINLMNLVAYELNVRGSSPWASIFTTEEWIAYEYYTTSGVYCGRGAGSVQGPIEGSLFLNATRNLFLSGPEESQLPLAFNFAHDTNIVQLVAAMGLDAPANRSDWDPTEVRFDQRFDVTEVVPQGARFVFERLVCDGDETEPSYVNAYLSAFNATNLVNATNTTNSTANSTVSSTSNSTSNSTSSNSTGSSNATSNLASNPNVYVRVVLNEAVVPIDGCSSGPGKSCSLDSFDKWVNEQLEGISFVDQCVIQPGQPTEFTLFKNHNLTTEYNPDAKFVPFQAGLLNSEGQPLSG